MERWTVVSYTTRPFIYKNLFITNEHVPGIRTMLTRILKLKRRKYKFKVQARPLFMRIK